MKRRISIFLAMVMIMVTIPTTGLAAETQEASQAVNVGITPDSRFYGIDSFLKELKLFFTFNTAKKAGVLCDIKEERLAEAIQMIEDNKAQYGSIAMESYKAALEKAVAVLDKAILADKDTKEVAKEFNETITEHEEMLYWVLDQFSEQDREIIEEPLVNTINDLVITLNIVDIDDDSDGAVYSEEPVDEDDEQEAKGSEESSDSAVDSEEPVDEDDEQEAEESEESLNGEDVANEEDISKKDSECEGDGKKLITVDVLTETVGEDVAELYINKVLNKRQILAVYAMSLKSEMSFDEGLEVFLENKGIGNTAKALGLNTKDALAAVKTVFKEVKNEIKERFNKSKQVDAADIGEDGEEPVLTTDYDHKQVREQYKDMNKHSKRDKYEYDNEADDEDKDNKIKNSNNKNIKGNSRNKNKPNNGNANSNGRIKNKSNNGKVNSNGKK